MREANSGGLKRQTLNGFDVKRYQNRFDEYIFPCARRARKAHRGEKRTGAAKEASEKRFIYFVGVSFCVYHARSQEPGAPNVTLATSFVRSKRARTE